MAASRPCRRRLHLPHCAGATRRAKGAEPANRPHRRHRRSSGDCKDPHALGLARTRSAARTGATLPAVPSGLTQSGFNISAGGPARPALAQAPRCASRSLRLADESAEQTRKPQVFSSNLPDSPPTATAPVCSSRKSSVSNSYAQWTIGRCGMDGGSNTASARSRRFAMMRRRRGPGNCCFGRYDHVPTVPCAYARRNGCTRAQLR